MPETPRTRFDSLHVEGFRRLRNLELKLRPFNVLIGANGSGKTSLLDVWTLLARSARGELGQGVSDLHGFMAFRSWGVADYVSFGTSLASEGQPPFEYRLGLAVRGAGYDISGEELVQELSGPGHGKSAFLVTDRSSTRYHDPKTKKLVKADWELKAGETALSQVPRNIREAERLRVTLASTIHYHALDVGPRAPVRLPQPMRPADLPGANGEDLVSCLFYLRETDRDRFEAVEDALRAAFPRFDRLEFPPVAAGTLALAWREIDQKIPFYAHQLSEGTLRFLWLVTLLQSPGLPAVTLIDEPEVSLHPELLHLLADLFREASTRTQLIVATHADRFVRFLHPNEVVAMDIDDIGGSSARWGDDIDLEKWLSTYTLDQIWSRGGLGGRAS